MYVHCSHRLGRGRGVVCVCPGVLEGNYALMLIHLVTSVTGPEVWEVVLVDPSKVPGPLQGLCGGWGEETCGAQGRAAAEGTGGKGKGLVAAWACTEHRLCGGPLDVSSRDVHAQIGHNVHCTLLCGDL